MVTVIYISRAPFSLQNKLKLNQIGHWLEPLAGGPSHSRETAMVQGLLEHIDFLLFSFRNMQKLDDNNRISKGRVDSCS